MNQSPDFNLLKYTFHLFKTKLKAERPANKLQLKTATVKAWQSITKEETQRLWCPRVPDYRQNILFMNIFIVHYFRSLEMRGLCMNIFAIPKSFLKFGCKCLQIKAESLHKFRKLHHCNAAFKTRKYIVSYHDNNMISIPSPVIWLNSYDYFMVMHL